MSVEIFNSTEKARLYASLKDACDSIDNLNTSILSTSDGHVVIVCSLVENLGYHRLSAMSASFARLSYTMANETNIGDVKRATVEAENGLLLSNLVNIKRKEFTLTMIFDRGVKTGMAHWAMTSISNHILEFKF